MFTGSGPNWGRLMLHFGIDKLVQIVDLCHVCFLVSQYVDTFVASLASEVDSVVLKTAPGTRLDGEIGCFHVPSMVEV
jgi:hypothetical protein